MPPAPGVAPAALQDQLLPDALRQHAAALLDQLQPLIQAWRPDQERVQAFTALAMQQGVAAAACAACLGLLLATIAAGWFALWHTTMKDIGFFRELLGLNRPKPEVKAQRQASMAAEIEKIKRQHSRSSARSIAGRQPNTRPA